MKKPHLTIKTLFEWNIFYSLYQKFAGNFSNFLNDNPSKYMFVIGVTGSNWKTTTATLLHHILNKTVSKTCLISTLQIKFGDQLVDSKIKKQNLNSFNVHELLASARDNGCRIAVMEISAKELQSWIFDYVSFDWVILTNLTHDHVDYDNNFSNEIQNTKKLFTSVLRNKKQNKLAVFPFDDKIWRMWFQNMPFDRKTSFSTHTTSTIKADEITQESNYTSFVLNYLGNLYNIKTKLLGRFNVYNILATIWMICEMWIPIDNVIEHISTFSPLPDRMEKVAENIYLDISHSPDALDKILQFLKHICKNRLIVVFGSPGGRDKKFRSQSGKIIQSYADITIATDQEPFLEDRRNILSELIQEIPFLEWEKFFIIPDRSLAIKFATNIAQEWDIILIACKIRWHNQRTNYGKIPRDDKKIILKNL